MLAERSVAAAAATAEAEEWKLFNLNISGNVFNKA
jgi:hypothetical protein